MKERVGDGKLIIISTSVSGINDHIRFYSKMLCTTAINTSNTIRTQNGAAERKSSGLDTNSCCYVIVQEVYNDGVDFTELS